MAAHAMTALYLAIAAVFAHLAWTTARTPAHTARWTTTAFWALLALAIGAGDWLPPVAVGAIVVVLAVLAGSGGVQRAPAAAQGAGLPQEAVTSIGDRVFLPALAIPVATVVLLYALKRIGGAETPLFTAQQATLLALGLACGIALVIALWLARARPAVAFEAGGRLLDAVGWAIILPLTLATLGVLFAAAGVGDTIAALTAGVVPVDNRFACVVAYCLGMAGFTMIMGNAFAAFPVMTAGVGLPLLVGRHGADPASMAAIGMLSGYCGTLMTPMAANFNIVPAILLELSDQYAVIKAQVPTALALLAINIGLMQAIVFR
jgi:uncharacterized membrane protein